MQQFSCSARCRAESLDSKFKASGPKVGWGEPRRAEKATPLPIRRIRADLPDFIWHFKPENSSGNTSGTDSDFKRSKTHNQPGASAPSTASPSRRVEDYPERVQRRPTPECLIDFEDPEDIELAAYEHDDIAELTNPRTPGESTITVAERHAFQKIFADIRARYQRGDVEYKVNVRPDLDATPRPSEGAQKKLQNVLDKAFQNRTQAAKIDIIKRYPPALRAAAAKAIGLELTSWEENAEAEHAEEAVNNKLLGMQDHKRMRVQELMKNAATDFELWDVMEREVFSLIAKLGLEDPPREEASGQKKGRKKKNKDVSVAEDRKFSLPTESSIDLEGNGVSPLALYGPLYGEYLLFSLRLLDRAFSKPSSLVLSVLPKIKSLGLVSSVLGGSTMLYNELLLIYQYRQDDYLGMLDLLSEMEHLGLEFDEKTHEIVVGVIKQQANIFRGEKGRTLRTVWNLPEYAPQQFAPWRDKIELAINEKQINLGLEAKY